MLQHIKWCGSQEDASSLTVTRVGAIMSLLTAAVCETPMTSLALPEPMRYDQPLLPGQGAWLSVRNDGSREIVLHLEVWGEQS